MPQRFSSASNILLTLSPPRTSNLILNANLSLDPMDGRGGPGDTSARGTSRRRRRLGSSPRARTALRGKSSKRARGRSKSRRRHRARNQLESRSESGTGDRGSSLLPSVPGAASPGRNGDSISPQHQQTEVQEKEEARLDPRELRRRVGRANALQRQRVELHGKQERVILKLSAAMVNNEGPEQVAKIQRQLHSINRALEALASRLLEAEELAATVASQSQDGSELELPTLLS